MTFDIGDYERLIEPNREQMIRTLWRILRDADDADDVLQGVLETLCRKPRLLCRHANPRAFILRVCINAAYDHLRRRKRAGARLDSARDTAEESGMDGADPRRGGRTVESPADIAARREEQQRALEAVARLPRREREALTLLAVEDLSYAEVASAMQCKESTTRVLVHKARQRLRSLMASEKEISQTGAPASPAARTEVVL